MKIFSIKNKKETYGYLFINHDYDDCYIELIEDLDYYPIFFKQFVDKRKYIINSYWTYKWIGERIIPLERQNINTILKENNINYYNELKMLISSKGYSSMDDNFIEPIKYDFLDEQIKKRRERLIKDFIIIKSSKKIVVFLENDESKIFDYCSDTIPFINQFGSEIIFTVKERYDYDYIFKNTPNSIFMFSDLKDYIELNLLSSSDITNTYGFKRQYLQTIKKKYKINPISHDLYLNNDIKTCKYKPR